MYNRKNLCTKTDSYKPSHALIYDDNMNLMFDYVEARAGGKWKFVQVAGIKAFISDYLLKPITQADVEYASRFFKRHYGFDLFDRKMRGIFEYIIKEYSGYIPITIKAVPEGMVN